MDRAIYEAAAYVMRYWFIIVMVVILLAVVVASVKEFRSRKTVMDRMQEFLGFLEIINAPDELMGQKFGVCDENTVGSAQDSDIRIDDDSIKRTHAIIYSRNEDLFLSPVAKSEIYVNGKETIRTHMLKTGDVIGIGDIDLRLFIKRKRVGNDY